MSYAPPAGNAALFTVRAATYPKAANGLDFIFPIGAYTPPLGGTLPFAFQPAVAPLVDWARPLGSAADFVVDVSPPFTAVGTATVSVTAEGYAKTGVVAYGAATIGITAEGTVKFPLVATGAAAIGVSALGFATLSRRVNLRTQSHWSSSRTQMRSVDSTIPKTLRTDRPKTAPWCAARTTRSEGVNGWKKTYTLDPSSGSKWGTSGVRRDVADKLPWGLAVKRDIDNAAPWSFFCAMLTVDQLNRWKGSKTADVLKKAVWSSRLIETRIPVEQPRAAYSAANFTVFGGGITTLMPAGIFTAPSGGSANFKFGSESYTAPWMSSRDSNITLPLGNAANFDYRPTYITLRDEFGAPVLRGFETQTVSTVPWGLAKILDKDQDAPWAKFSRPINPGWGVPTEPGGNPVPVPGQTITVPVQRVYIVLNEIQLLRVSNTTPIPALSMSVSFDCDSWLPQFSATIPESAREAIMPDPSPVEVEVIINGTQFRFFVERISRARQFGQNTISISGRGIACELDAPYATASQWTNSTQMTAQQIIADTLTNTGYTQTWNITDWLVPANTFSQFGTPSEVAASVAEASGSVLQADWLTRDLRMLPRYPVKPWDWATATPSYVIPGAVTQTESLEWSEKPAYNVVYVSGVQNGVLGQVKITGTAGDLAAPMYTHPLITHIDAARQKGISILGDTGRKTTLQIAMPILPATGVIDVCTLIEFNDGATARRGIVRANNISVNWPTVRQTLTIEANA